MSRHARVTEAGEPWHVWQRGVNRCRCFAGPGDRIHYLSLLSRFARRHGCDVHAYVLMTNHVHLLVTPHERLGVSRMMKDLGQHYVQDFNRANHRTGTLWEGRFRSSVIESDQYLLTCYRYIELNPVRAAMVNHPGDYEWSSYRANADGLQSDVITPHPLFAALGESDQDRRRAYRELFGTAVRDEDLTAIRQAVMSGRALGSPAHSWGLNASVGMSPARLRRPRYGAPPA
jgi:putative transposase